MRSLRLFLQRLFPNGIYLLKCLTGLSICYVFYLEMPQYPFYWSLVSVVIAIAPDNSNRQAYDRIIANLLGCTVGLLLYPIGLPGLIVLCIGVTVTIAIGYAVRKVDALRSALAALVIVLLHEREVREWYIPLQRVGCVVAGCLVALLVTLVFNFIGRRLRSGGE